MTAPVYFKDPNETIKIVFDWTSRLGGQTIATSVWVVPSGLTETAESETTTTATLTLPGGTAGIDYLVTNRITTSGGETIDRSAIIRCRDL